MRVFSYKSTPYLRDAGVFRTQAADLNARWAAAWQRGRCNVKGAENISLQPATSAALPRLEQRLLTTLKGSAQVRPLTPGRSPGLFRVDVSGKKPVAMTLTRLKLPDGTPALIVRACRMEEPAGR